MKIQPCEVLGEERAQEIIRAARALLEQIGIRVIGPELQRSLKQTEAFRQKDGRWLIDGAQFDAFADRWRSRPLPQPHTRLEGESSFYSSFLRDAHSGLVAKMTTERLRKMTLFGEKVAMRYPLSPVVPGYPTDVPGELSSLMRYKLALELCSRDVVPTPDAVFASDYMFAMAQAAGKKMDRLPVYPISPLTLGGDSAEIVLRHNDKLESFYVFTMPLMGVTAPMHITMGYAMAFAETVGSAILMEAMTGVSADIRPNLDPTDLRHMSIAFGTPLKFFLEQAGYELLSAFRGEPFPRASVNIHTLAKECDARAAMEKGMLMLAGALQGARKFYCVGTLSLDELFDPLQLLMDLEMLGYVQNFLDGPLSERMEPEFVEEICEGLSSGFACSDRTLEEYQSYLPLPCFAEATSWQSWNAGGAKGTLERLRERYDEIDALSYTPSIIPDVQRALDAIYAEAEQELHSRKNGIKA
mgnify:CR=1 FL=1